MTHKLVLKKDQSLRNQLDRISVLRPVYKNLSEMFLATSFSRICTATDYVI